MRETHYADFNVMDSQEAWDKFSRSVATQRLEPQAEPTCLGPKEKETLHAVLHHLLYEERDGILSYVSAYIDRQLQSKRGESQRKVGTPAEAALIRKGLAALEDIAHHKHSSSFVDCSIQQQFQILAQLQKGELEQIPQLSGVPQKDLFNKVLSLSIEAYASYPVVWSEMGYAGPAYPRGYYHIELNMRDAWEPAFARRDSDDKDE